MDVKKPEAYALLHFFWHCETHFYFFPENLKVPQGSPLSFSPFATNWSFTKPKGPPFTINFELRYSADFGRPRLVSLCYMTCHDESEEILFFKFSQTGLPDPADHSLTILLHHTTHTTFLTMILP